MQKSLLLFTAVLLFSLLLFAQGQPAAWIGIDCGSNRSTTTFGYVWETDQNYIKSGTNAFVNTPTPTPLVLFNTVRVFTDQNKNCYTLPKRDGSSYWYFVRAAFLYANYDGKSSPPTFDLEIDGNKWTTVVTSSTDYTYYEILYWSEKRNMSVCLARTKDVEFPFISSLEAWPISYGMYTALNQDLGWMNSYRYDYGPNNGILGYWGGDQYNRIWEPTSVPGAFNTSGGDTTNCAESPPDSATEDAIEALDNTTSLFLTFNQVKKATPIYIVPYFTLMQSEPSNARSFDIYIAGDPTSLATITPSDFECIVEPLFAQVSGDNLTVELRPTAESTLPPIISAIEVYTATDPLITTGTDQRDLNGVMNFTTTYDRLEGWSGEPCLPSDTAWQWLRCGPTLPPRVTALYLSGYELNGNLFNFSQMQALVDIDLSNNNLSGEIPSFLGQLPNLKTLNLSYNDFSGAVPISIRSNNKLAFDATGNPNLSYKKGSSSSKALVIGLAVGIPLIVIILLILLFLWIRSKRGQTHNQETETGNGSINAPQPSAPPVLKDEEDDYVAVNKIDERVDHSMVPDLDLDELEGLVDQYVNDGDHHQLRIDGDDDDDYVAVGDHSLNGESMVPDLDLEELHDVIHQEKQKAEELGKPKSDT